MAKAKEKPAYRPHSNGAACAGCVSVKYYHDTNLVGAIQKALLMSIADGETIELNADGLAEFVAGVFDAATGRVLMAMQTDE
jgi:hypothetical protein